MFKAIKKSILALLLLSFIGCSEETGIGFNTNYSGCGGFSDTSSKVVSNLTSEEDIENMVCHQKIVWTRLDDEVVRFRVQRVTLNCCGETEFRVYKNDSNYELRVIDESDNGMRCSCSCNFDFESDVKIAPQSTDIRLTVDIEESGKETLYEGNLDLTGSGEVIIKEYTGYSCMH
ncbi:hypothetical protein JXR93_00590 [bacterium]|nr:hypothetical protein [bacterium]